MHVRILTVSSLSYQAFQITAQNILLRSYKANETEGFIIKDKIVSAARDMADLFKEVQDTLSRGHFGIYYAQAPAIAALNLVQFLADPDIPDIFHTLIVVLVSVARRWAVARGIIRMIWFTSTRLNLDGYILVPTARLLKLSATERWEPHEWQQLAASTYPNYAEIQDRGRDFVEMGSLLQEYAAMQIANDAETSELAGRSHSLSSS